MHAFVAREKVAKSNAALLQSALAQALAFRAARNQRPVKVIIHSLLTAHDITLRVFQLYLFFSYRFTALLTLSAGDRRAAGQTAEAAARQRFADQRGPLRGAARQPSLRLVCLQSHMPFCLLQDP